MGGGSSKAALSARGKKLAASKHRSDSQSPPSGEGEHSDDARYHDDRDRRDAPSHARHHSGGSEDGTYEAAADRPAPRRVGSGGSGGGGGGGGGGSTRRSNTNNDSFHSGDDRDRSDAEASPATQPTVAPQSPPLIAAAPGGVGAPPFGSLPSPQPTPLQAANTGFSAAFAIPPTAASAATKSNLLAPPPGPAGPASGTYPPVSNAEASGAAAPAPSPAPTSTASPTVVSPRSAGGAVPRLPPPPGTISALASSPIPVVTTATTGPSLVLAPSARHTANVAAAASAVNASRSVGQSPANNTISRRPIADDSHRTTGSRSGSSDSNDRGSSSRAPNTKNTSSSRSGTGSGSTRTASSKSAPAKKKRDSDSDDDDSEESDSSTQQRRKAEAQRERDRERERELARKQREREARERERNRERDRRERGASIDTPHPSVGTSDHLVLTVMDDSPSRQTPHSGDEGANRYDETSPIAHSDDNDRYREHDRFDSRRDAKDEPRRLKENTRRVGGGGMSWLCHRRPEPLDLTVWSDVVWCIGFLSGDESHGTSKRNYGSVNSDSEETSGTQHSLEDDDRKYNNNNPANKKQKIRYKFKRTRRPMNLKPSARSDFNTKIEMRKKLDERARELKEKEISTSFVLVGLFCFFSIIR